MGVLFITVGVFFIIYPSTAIKSQQRRYTRASQYAVIARSRIMRGRMQHKFFCRTIRMCNRYAMALWLGLTFGTSAWAANDGDRQYVFDPSDHDLYAAQASNMFRARKREKLEQWRIAQTAELRGFQLDTSAGVAGLDNNQNGIRDDIEYWIEQHFDDELSAQAAHHLAKAVQQTLVVNLNDKEAVKLAAREHTIVSSCAVDMYQDVQRAESLINHVQRYTVNTTARQQAFDQFHAALEDSHFYIPTTKDCDIRGLLGNAVSFAIAGNAVTHAPLTR